VWRIERQALKSTAFLFGTGGRGPRGKCAGHATNVLRTGCAGPEGRGHTVECLGEAATLSTLLVSVLRHRTPNLPLLSEAMAITIHGVHNPRGTRKEF
jgi:hypothetical protein